VSRIVVAAGLLAAAGFLHFGYAAVARGEAQALAAEHGRAFGKRQEVRERRARLDQRRAEYERVSSVLASVARGSDDPTGDLRRAVLPLLREADLQNVHVLVGPGRESVGATLTVSGSGRVEDVARFASALVQPNPGVVLERVGLSAQPSSVSFEIRGARLRGAK